MNSQFHTGSGPSASTPHFALFVGDVSVVTWNCNGLFAANLQTAHDRTDFVASLAARYDLVFLQ